MNNEGIRKQEEDGEGQEGRTRAGMLCVSGTTTQSKKGIYKCKSLLANVRKTLNHGTDYSGVTLILFLFLKNPNNSKPQKL